MEGTSLLPTAEAGPRHSWSFYSMSPNAHYMKALLPFIQQKALGGHLTAGSTGLLLTSVEKKILYTIKKKKKEEHKVAPWTRNKLYIIFLRQYSGIMLCSCKNTS